MKALFFITLVAVFYSNVSFAKDWKCEFPLPYLVDGCDGTGCDALTYDRAVADAKLYLKPNIQSKLVGEVKRCDFLKSVKGYKLIQSFGKLKVNVWPENYNDLPVKHGDIVEYMNYTGEGGYRACIGKKEYNVSSILITQEALRPKKGYQYKLADFSSVMPIDEGKSKKWFKVETEKGVTGYASVGDEQEMFFIPYSGFKKGLFCQEDTALGLKEKEKLSEMAVVIQKYFNQYYSQITQECTDTKAGSRVCGLNQEMQQESLFEKINLAETECRLAGETYKNNVKDEDWVFIINCKYKSPRSGAHNTSRYSIMCKESESNKISCR